MKLSKTQQDLLEKMQAGEVLHFMAYCGIFNPSEYFFCGTGGNRCTAAAKALIKKGLVGFVGEPWKRSYQLTDDGKSWKPTGTEAKNETKTHD